MTENEIMSMIIEEITEYELCKFRKEKHKEYDKLNSELRELSGKVRDILSGIPPEQADVINSYIAKQSALADMDCTFLYTQGARDCVKLLKKLEIL
ncbi:MAG: hypothetical protein LUF26_08295 [Firmicutes bacterium]|nr:hypothetical protein [Bacillota bacterium]